MSGSLVKPTPPATSGPSGESQPLIVDDEGRLVVRVEGMEELTRLMREMVFHLRIITDEEYEDDDDCA